MADEKDWIDYIASASQNLTNIKTIDKINNINGMIPHSNYSLNDNDTGFLEYSNFTTDDYCSSNHSHVYLNVTCEFPINYAEPMYGYIAPFLLATTTVANTLIVVVLSRRHMRTPTNVVLMAMALCDMFTMLFPAPWLFYMYTFGNHYKPLSPIQACQAWNYMNEVIPAMFHTASIWLTLALAVQRYIYVCHAPVARTWCTMPRVMKCLIYIGIAAFLHQLPRFLDRQYVPHITVWRGHFEEVCRIEMAPWVHALSLDETHGNIKEILRTNIVRQSLPWWAKVVEFSPWVNKVSLDAYFSTYFGFRVIFVHLVPCTSLVVLNVLLFKAMRQAQMNRRRLFKENPKNECKKLRDSNCTTLMLIVVVTVFLVVEIPLAVVTILHIISSTIVEFLDYRIANILILITNFFIMASYPINFAIYCGMSRQFRETFKELFIRSVVSSRNGASSRYSLVNGPRTCTNETVL
ncbi:FMRFamide receptor [Papilio xuthus]|uniref:FMRFamide receptor n=1 Tax=Papilio xuthus TaxID=66420 RepID=A0A194QE30_PAPXU|nr:FMRFamide receptor [Papilio xuthus]